jgi:hypothetical protein
MTVTLEKLRDLDLAAATGPGRPLHLSAASGLVCVGDQLNVVGIIERDEVRDLQSLDQPYKIEGVSAGEQSWHRSASGDRRRSRHFGGAVLGADRELNAIAPPAP